jgi:CMP-N,N'-diacetyllegionaminic acid synthase
MTKILCTICARKGSKGLKNKNIKKINGKILFLYTFEMAKKINFVDKIVVSTDSNYIKKIVGKNYCWFLRNKNLSYDKISKIDVIRDAVIKAEKNFSCKYDIILDLDVTSPLRKKKDIIASYNIFKNKNYNNLFSVTESVKNPYFNMVEVYKGKVTLCKKSINYFTRQSAPKVYGMNASIYFWKRNVLFSKNPIFNKKTGIYKMPKERSFDIDNSIDFLIVKKFINAK